jgi:hypothetical protein
VTRLVIYAAAQAILDHAARVVEAALRVRDLVQDVGTLLTEDGP